MNNKKWDIEIEHKTINIPKHWVCIHVVKVSMARAVKICSALEWQSNQDSENSYLAFLLENKDEVSIAGVGWSIFKWNKYNNEMTSVSIEVKLGSKNC